MKEVIRHPGVTDRSSLFSKILPLWGGGLGGGFDAILWQVKINDLGLKFYSVEI